MFIVRTRLQRPRLPARLVARPRLLDRLDEGSARRVSLIAAPAGYGKTTLALQWLAERVGDSAWISLDDRASELERFMAYLVEAVRGVRPHALPRTAALLDARTPPAKSYLVECLFAELALVDAPLVLALDDCHCIASRDVHDLVRGMVESLPAGFHLLAIGRTDPPWPLARWRGRGWLSELRARDLRFDRGEVREFFASADAPALDPSDLDILGDRTEGWPAGLQLAKISIAQAPDPRERARRFSGDDRLVVDFLMSEVLAMQPPELLELFAVTAPLDRFCATLCAHLLKGRVHARDAGALLDRLEQGNLFLVPLDAEHRWFRYHRLFRDLLLRHLAEAGSAEVRARVAGRAAEWFAREGLVEEAIGLWVAAGELDRAAELFGRNLHQAIDADNSRRILSRWLELFPAGQARDRLPLLVARAYQAIVRFDVQAIAELLERAKACRGQDDGPLAADLEALSAYLRYWQGDAAASLRHAERALSLLGGQRGGMTWSAAQMYRSGALSRLGRAPEAIRHLEAEERESQSRGSAQSAELLAIQALVLLYDADLVAVAAAARRLIELDASIPVQPNWLAYAYYALGAVALERDQLDDAEEHFRRLDGFRFLTAARLSVDGLVGLALVADRRSDPSRLEAWTAAARSFAVQASSSACVQAAESLESRFAPSAERRRVPDPPATGPLDSISFWLVLPTLTHAENLLRHPDPELRRMALPYVDSLLAANEAVHNHRHEIRLQVLRADALLAAGEEEAAREVLEAALRRAEPQHMVRPFLGGGPERLALLRALSTRQEGGGFLAQVVGAASPAAAIAPRPAAPALPAAAAGEPLTLRERETLELLARRLSNKEIAARLSLTPGAVKKRLQGLYVKLEASDRLEAVATAVAQGIIEKPPL